MLNQSGILLNFGAVLTSASQKNSQNSGQFWLLRAIFPSIKTNIHFTLLTIHKWSTYFCVSALFLWFFLLKLWFKWLKMFGRPQREYIMKHKTDYFRKKDSSYILKNYQEPNNRKSLPKLIN